MLSLPERMLRREQTPLRYAVEGGQRVAAQLLRAAGGVLLWPEADGALRQVRLRRAELPSGGRALQECHAQWGAPPPGPAWRRDLRVQWLRSVARTPGACRAMNQAVRTQPGAVLGGPDPGRGIRPRARARWRTCCCWRRAARPPTRQTTTVAPRCTWPPRRAAACPSTPCSAGPLPFAAPARVG